MRIGHVYADLQYLNWYIYAMNKNMNGFTLLELLVTLVIGAILVAIAIPSFENTIDRNRLTSSYNSLIGELTYTRSEAVKRGTNVSICASSDQATCNVLTWEAGRLVFVDINGNGDVDVGDTLLKVFGALAGDTTIRSSALADAGVMVFDSGGVISDTGTLIVCDSRGAQEAKGVNMSLIGLPQRATDTDATPNGTVDDVADAEVTCP